MKAARKAVVARGEAADGVGLAWEVGICATAGPVVAMGEVNEDDEEHILHRAREGAECVSRKMAHRARGGRCGG